MYFWIMSLALGARSLSLRAKLLFGCILLDDFDNEDKFKLDCEMLKKINHTMYL
jgi:hypothetical protein